MLTTFDFANRTFEVSVLSHQEVKSPWQPKMGNVIKYLIEVSCGGCCITFDFFGSIADCDSKKRAAYNRLSAFLSGENTGIHFVDSGETPEIRKARMREKINEIAINVSGTADSYFGTADTFRRIGEEILKAKKAQVSLFYSGYPALHKQVIDFCKRIHAGEDISDIAPIPKIKYIDTKEALLWVLKCWLSDASVGHYTVDELQGELGFENPSELLKAHRGCQTAAIQAQTLGLDTEDVCDVIEALTKMGIE